MCGQSTLNVSPYSMLAHLITGDEMSACMHVVTVVRIPSLRQVTVARRTTHSSRALTSTQHLCSPQLLAQGHYGYRSDLCRELRALWVRERAGAGTGDPTFERTCCFLPLLSLVMHTNHSEMLKACIIHLIVRKAVRSKCSALQGLRKKNTYRKHKLRGQSGHHIGDLLEGFVDGSKDCDRSLQGVCGCHSGQE